MSDQQAMTRLLPLAALVLAASPVLAQDVVVFRTALAKAKPRAPSATCGALTRNIFTGAINIGRGATLADAQAVCNAYRASSGKPGSCSWQNSTAYSDYKTVFWNNDVRNDANPNSDLWGATCA